MHYQLATPAGRWDDGREERLLLSFLLAAAIVAVALALIRIPSLPPFVPVMDLVVRLVQPEAQRSEEAAASETTSSAEPAPAEPSRSRAEPGPVVQTPDAVVPAAPDQTLDIDTLREDAVQQYLERTEDQAWAFDPRVDELRREGRLRYQPPTIEQPGPIWENVEQDQLGRTILRDGDCWKVVDDPNVGSQYQFQEFGQYLTMCTFQPRAPQELPWVATIREQYDYLKYPDGEIPDEEMPEQSRD